MKYSMTKINHHRRTQVVRAQQQAMDQYRYGAPYKKRFKRKKKPQASPDAVDQWLAQGGVVQQYSNVSRADAKKFYQSQEWRNTRTQVHKTKNLGYCANCGIDWKYKITAMKCCVDHIKPLRFYWHLRTDIDNLQVLCEYCNSKKSAHTGTQARKVLLEAKQLRYQELKKHLLGQ